MFVQIEKNMLAQSDNFQINSMLQDHERALEGPTVGILEMAWIAHRQSPFEIHSHAGLSWFLLSLEKMFFFFIFFLLFFFVSFFLYFCWLPSLFSFFFFVTFFLASFLYVIFLICTVWQSGITNFHPLQETFDRTLFVKCCHRHPRHSTWGCNMI